MRRITIAIVLLAVGCASTTSGGAACSPAPSTVRFAQDARLTVGIADTDSTREQGLMGVRTLPPDQGMAFVWDGPTEATFWMKDTLIPLSIAFVDQNGHVLNTDEMAPCDSDPCPTYAPSAPYTTAIEANAGWFEQHGVKAGDEMKLLRVSCQ
jgi:uncharacterized membrane protein (UPF0127 family)